MLSAENLASIESEGRRLGAAVRSDPDAGVPQYPGWSLADLASHTASIHGRTILICRELPAQRISAPRLPLGRDPLDWYEETLDEMLATLAQADPESPVWTFDPSGKLGFWERRMVVETGTHRWDAEQSVGPVERLTDRVVAAGLDEFGGFWFRHLGDVQTLEVIATDLGRSWVFGEGEPFVRREEAGSEIYLRMMSRPSSVVLPDDWAAAVDSLTPPPKR
ncbi:MAG: maleylpyruvate isomerase family mycothiol-dependent enzyme [Actinomycetota bacterium]|nr:maleylpyruvate isomerase family mycothiol-dependent enzyme [Actinomycetota bacterium]